MALADYIFQKPVIDTERLTLRPMRAEDVPALKQWLPDPSIYTYWGKGPSKAEKNPELLFEKDNFLNARCQPRPQNKVLRNLRSKMRKLFNQVATV